MFIMVPNPGRSLNGIQSKSTTQLIKAVTPPIGNAKCNETPSASTVHGELPIPDCNKKASPNPKTNKPSTNTKTRKGEIAHREGALQGVFGIVR